MKLRSLVVLALVGLACSRSAAPSEPESQKAPFTILATGDVGGEIAPCG